MQEMLQSTYWVRVCDLVVTPNHYYYYYNYYYY